MKIFTYESSTNLISKSYATSLKSILKTAVPNISINIQPADSNLSSILNNWNGHDDLLTDYFESTTDTRILLCTTKNSKYYNWCIQQLMHAKWGCSISEFLAIEYAPEPNKLTTQLHESLHLFGVDDCYKENNQSPKTSCLNESCFMRYGNNSKTVCDSVLTQLNTKLA